MDRHNRDAQEGQCPRCRQAMKLVRTIPGFGALRELLVFSCKSCGEVETREKGPAA
jgi:C4-type Zn-finger protein